MKTILQTTQQKKRAKKVKTGCFFTAMILILGHPLVVVQVELDTGHQILLLLLLGRDNEFYNT